MEERVIELANGLRITHKYVPYTRLVHCGFIVNVGGRDDGADTGMAHFLEHIVFKGTAHRKTYHILNYLECVGGDLNAYTTKEKTCVYASISSEYVARAFDLLSDIVFHSIFPEKEIQKEKQVIAEEIDMYRDTPDEAILEDFDLYMFPQHSLGLPILGTKESLEGITREKITKFIEEHYTSDNVIFSVVGNITEKEVRKLAEKYLSKLPLKTGKIQRHAPTVYESKLVETHISGSQSHEMFGGRACDLSSDEYPAFLLLNNILGGPAMNSRLSLNIREKYGWAYSINSFYAPLVDTGMWGVYYGCDPKNAEKVRAKVLKEIDILRKNPIGTQQLQQAIKQMTGQLIMGNESLVAQMLAIGKELLDFEHLTDFSEYLKEIEQVTAIQIQELAQKYMNPENLVRVSYLPKEEEE